MTFIVDKCNTMHIKKCNPTFIYTTVGSELTEVLGLEHVAP